MAGAGRRTVPFLPGQCIDPSPRHHFPHTTRFDLIDGQAISDPLERKAPVPPAKTNIVQWVPASTTTRTQSDLRPRLKNTDVTMGTVPSWIANDQQVLRFYGYYQQSVYESQIETHRIIPIVLLYYLQDGTARITESKEDNNGLRHGDILARARISLADTDLPRAGTSPYLSHEHLGTRMNISIFGRVYRLVDADPFTRQFYAGDLAPAEPIPVDPFHQRQIIEKSHRQGQYEPVSAHYESVHGRPQPWQLERSRQFLALDGKVLRFWARWNDRHLVVHYFLADDTVEVLEIAQANSGRDPVPALVKRQRLRKATPAFGIDQIGEYSDHGECYNATDFQIGRVIRVFGRDVVLERADDFTKKYYKEHFGIDLSNGDGNGAAAESAGRHEKGADVQEMSEQEAIEAAQKALKSRRNRPDSDHRRLAKQAMRFKARQVSTRPEDVAREFVITFFPVDETVSVFENPIRNSGFIAGKFLERSLTYNHEKKRMFKMEDFHIGARVQIHSFVFELIDADTATRHRLQTPGAEDISQRRMDFREVRAGLRALLNNKNTALRKTFRNFDNDKDGLLSKAEFNYLLNLNGWDLDVKQSDAIFQEFDHDKDGMISFNDFASEVEGPGR